MAQRYIVSMKPGVPPLALWFYQRVINNNLNALCCFVGPTGGGKSYAAMRLAENISKLTGNEFNEDYICFTPHDFMRTLNSDKMKRGSVIILDEAGVAINSRKWQSTVNVMINKIVQTFRHRNYIVLMCVPDFGFIDASIRKMFHMLVEMKRIDFRERISWCKPQYLQTNAVSGKTYHKGLVYKSLGVKPRIMQEAGFKKPTKDLLKAYEQKKTEFTDQLNKSVEDDLFEEENKDSNKKELTGQQEIVLKLRNEYGLNGKKIAQVMGITEQAIGHHIKFIRNKGFVLQKPNTKRKELTNIEIDELKKLL